MPGIIEALIVAGTAAGGTFGTQLAIGSSLIAATKAAAITGSLLFVSTLARQRGGSRVSEKGTITSSALPARWILGRNRVGGMLVYYKESNFRRRYGPREVDLAMVVSEGPLDSIEKIWVNGEEIPILSRTEDHDGVHLNFGDGYAGKIAVWEYFAADGTGGRSLRDRTKLSDVRSNPTFRSEGEPDGGGEPDDGRTPVPRPGYTGAWTDRHKLYGKSWVHIALYQNDYEEVDERNWKSFPEIEFLIKGLKITWPGQETPTWTNNAAAVRHWYMVEQCGIDPEQIDRVSFDAAYKLCEEPVLSGDQSTRRYTIDGVVSSEDSAEQLAQEFDFCWQGHVVEANARFYFRPYIERPVSRVLDNNDILELVSVQIAPILQDRVNSVSMKLAQSSGKGWQEQDLPQITEVRLKEERDNGEELWVNLGTRRFIVDPNTGQRLLSIALQRAQNLTTYVYRATLGYDLGWLKVIPSDWILVLDEELDIESVTEIIDVVTNEDWSTTLTLQKQEVATRLLDEIPRLPERISHGGFHVVIRPANIVVSPGEEITLNADVVSFNNPGDSVKSYRWYTVDAAGQQTNMGKFSSISNQSVKWTAPALEDGATVYIVVQVTDNNGDFASSEPAVIVIDQETGGERQGFSFKIVASDLNVLSGGQVRFEAIIPDTVNVKTIQWYSEGPGRFTKADQATTFWDVNSGIQDNTTVLINCIVTDINNISVTESVTINIGTVEEFLAAVIPEKFAVTSGETITVKVISSLPIRSYRWFTRADVGMFENGAIASTRWTAPILGADATVFLSCEVIDENGNSVTIDAAIKVIASTAPHLTIVASSIHIDGGETIQLTAISGDPDGIIVSHAWSILPDKGSFSSTTTASTTWTAPAATSSVQRYTIKCVVTDNSGQTDMATIVITIEERAEPIVGIIADDTTVGGGQTVQLDVIAIDPDGSIASYKWTATSGTLSSTTIQNPVWTAPAATEDNQTVTITCEVTDNDGHTDTDSITIIVLEEHAPSVVVISSEASVLGEETVQLNAIAEDPDGEIVSYAWTTNLGRLSSTTVADPTWTAPTPTANVRVATITCVVTGSQGNTATDSISIQVVGTRGSAGSAPLVNVVASDASVGSRQLVKLNAVAVVASDRTIDSYEWTQSGDASGVFANTNRRNPTWTAPVSTDDQQEITITCKVTDSANISVSDSVTIRVHAATPPSLNVVASSIDVHGREVVELKAVAEDFDGKIASYRWSQTGSAGVFSSTTKKAIRWTAPFPSLRIQATEITCQVTDDSGRTASDSVEINVRANILPITNLVLNKDAVLIPGESIAATCIAFDRDGEIKSFAWVITASRIGTGSSQRLVEYPHATERPRGSISPTEGRQTIYTAPATYGGQFVQETLACRVTDDDNGVASVSTQINLVRSDTDTGVPPQLTLTITPRTVTSGGKIRCVASAFDPDGTIASYAWTATRVIGGTATQVGSFSSTTTNAVDWTAPTTSSPITVTIGCSVRDNHGNSVTESERVNVNPAVVTTNQDPTVSISGSSRANAGATVSLRATANDPDGANSAITYRWTATGGTFSGSTTRATASWRAPSPSSRTSYTITCTVTDEDGATGSDTHTISVAGRVSTALRFRWSLRSGSSSMRQTSVSVLDFTSSGGTGPFTLRVSVSLGLISLFDRSGTGPGPTTLRESSHQSLRTGVTYITPQTTRSRRTGVVTGRLTDSNGNSVTDTYSFTIQAESGDLTVSITHTGTRRRRNEGFVLTANVSGGNGRYTYLWVLSGYSGSSSLNGQRSRVFRPNFSSAQSIRVTLRVTDSAGKAGNRGVTLTIT